MQAKNITIDKSLMDKKTQDKLTKIFHLYMTEGGFPEIINFTPDIRQRTLQEYVDIVIYRDIIERHTIPNTPLIKYMILSMVHNVAKPFSINKFYNDLKTQGYKVGKDMLYEYSSYIEDAYLSFLVPIYSKSIRKIQANPKKIYAIDTGLIRAVVLHYANDFGKLFENLIYLDLRRKGYIVHYYLTRQRYEIDFLVQNRQGEKQLLQVVWDMDNKDTLEREKRALKEAQKELHIPGSIITLDSYLYEDIYI